MSKSQVENLILNVLATLNCGLSRYGEIGRVVLCFDIVLLFVWWLSDPKISSVCIIVVTMLICVITYFMFVFGVRFECDWFGVVLILSFSFRR